MTFTKWWNKTISYQYLTNVDLVNKNTAKQLAHDAWQAAQPKWTLCKDKMPDYDKPCLLKVKTFNGESAEITILCGCRCPYTPTEDEIGYGHTIDVFYIDIIDVTGTPDAVQIDDIDDVIAWMPLSEVEA